MILYHVVPGKVFSKDLQNEQLVNTVEGSPIRINIYNVGQNRQLNTQQVQNRAKIRILVKIIIQFRIFNFYKIQNLTMLTI